MNLIKLTRFTSREEGGASGIYIDYSFIALIEEMDKGAQIYLSDSFGDFNGGLHVKETAKEIRDEIAKIETNKMIDKINYQQSANAISKDWTEDMYEKVDAKKE